MRKPLSLCVVVNAVILIGLCLYVFVLPAGTIAWNLRDPGLAGDTIPGFVFRWHRALSPRYERWARQRVASGAADQLTTENISGTEWPLFGSVFYLWATEAMQEAYEVDPNVAPSAPIAYARGAIEAATALVADPNHAGWVKQHWGEQYLEKENLFFRMLLISALRSYQKLLDDARYEDLLRSQVESLAAELDASRYGLLDDYPGQCYPVDIVPAIAAIRRADAVLGTDHAAFAARAIRGFQGTRLDEHTGLPAYVVSSTTGKTLDCARGVGLSFMLIWAPELWPETVGQWYAKYRDQFWQQDRWFAGFREYPADVDVGWFAMQDVDAGPVIAGYGMAASAFGAGAVRAMGDAERAYLLGAEALVASWPLPDGTLLVPRLLSNFSDAPYLGEAATLFALTRCPVTPMSPGGRPALPGIVYLGLGGLLCFGLGEMAASLWQLRRWYRKTPRRYVPMPQFQLALWLALLVGAFASWMLSSGWLALVLVLTGQILPRQRKCSAPTTEKEAAQPSA